MYKAQRNTKVYNQEETSTDLKLKYKKTHERLKKVEGLLNRDTLGLKRKLNDDLKEQDGDLTLWTVCEMCEYRFTEKNFNQEEINLPEGHPFCLQTKYFSPDDKEARIFDSEEEVRENVKTRKKAGLTVESFQLLELRSVVNVFLTSEDAEQHVKDNLDKYTRPKIFAIKPLENPQLHNIINYFRTLGDNLGNVESIFQEAEEYQEYKETFRNLKKEKEELQKKFFQQQQEMKAVAKKYEELQLGLKGLKTK